MIHLANCSVTINCILKCQEKMALKLFERWACKVGLAHNARPLWCCRRDVSLKEFSALGNVDRSLVKELWVYVVWNFSSDCVRKKFSNVLLEIISIIPLVNCLALTLKKKNDVVYIRALQLRRTSWTVFHAPSILVYLSKGLWNFKRIDEEN